MFSSVSDRVNREKMSFFSMKNSKIKVFSSKKCSITIITLMSIFPLKNFKIEWKKLKKTIF